MFAHECLMWALLARELKIIIKFSPTNKKKTKKSFHLTWVQFVWSQFAILFKIIIKTFVSKLIFANAWMYTDISTMLYQCTMKSIYSVTMTALSRTWLAICRVTGLSLLCSDVISWTFEFLIELACCRCGKVINWHSVWWLAMWTQYDVSFI